MNENVRYIQVVLYLGDETTVHFNQVSAIQCPLDRGISMRVYQENNRDLRLLSVLARCPLQSMSTIDRFHCTIEELRLILKKMFDKLRHCRHLFNNWYKNLYHRTSESPISSSSITILAKFDVKCFIVNNPTSQITLL